MFSGIVEDLGLVLSVSPRGAGRTLVLQTRLPIDPPGSARGGGPERGLRLGDSVAVCGACLTVEALDGSDRFTVACGRETLERTTLGGLKARDRVHLERALRLGDRLDGHLVSGHVDGVGEVLQAERQQESVVVWIAPPPALARYIAVKGSICVDGVSLTVNELAGDAFRINLIPYTTNVTLLASYRAGHRVNLEVDLLARYVERLVGGVGGGLTVDRLVALGFAAPSKEHR